MKHFDVKNSGWEQGFNNRPLFYFTTPELVAELCKRDGVCSYQEEYEGMTRIIISVVKE